MHEENVAFRGLKHLVAIILLAVPASSPAARAQESAPVTVDASPSAAQLLQQAEAAAVTGPAEASRLAQEAVDRFAGKLVPWPPEPDRFRPVEVAVSEFLRAHPEVLARWLAIEGPVAERQLEEGQRTSVALLRPMAPAALPATLTLAQAALDAGRTSEAWSWLDRAMLHPDLRAEDRARVEAARRVIQARRAAVPTAPAARGPADGIQIWQPLWTQPIASAWITRRVRDLEPQQASQLQQNAIVDGAALLAAPTFDRGMLLVADGVQVTSFDRFSGSVLWSASVGRGDDRLAGPMGDIAAAVTAGDRLVTLPGQAVSEQRSAPPGVLELQVDSGRRSWEFRLDRSPLEAMEELFPHGRPVVIDDVTVAQARKSNSRLESAAWLLGLDRLEERLRWMVPLGAAGGLRLAASRPLGSPAPLDGDVVAASSLGVVARVDAGLGRVRWLRRWPPPVREPRDSSPAWQLPSPVADDRLVAWIAPDGATLVGMDPADGKVLWSRPIGVDTPAGLVRTLLLDADHLYAIGTGVIAIPRSDPQAIAWKLPVEEGATVRGEVAMGTLADGARALVVPTVDRVLIVSPQDGGLIGQLPLESGGNTALQGGQLAVVTADRASVAMPGDQGETLLRRRLAERPDDPRRGLALIELGRAWKRGTLMVDGAVATARALGTLGDAEAVSVREEVVRRLLDPVVLATVGTEQAGRLLALAADLARTPAQRASVMLRQAAQASAEGRGSEAASLLQRLWCDSALARAMLPITGDLRIAAGDLALAGLMGLDAADRQRALRACLPLLRAADASDRPARLRQLARLAGSREELDQILGPLPISSDSCEALVLAQVGRRPASEGLAACGPPQASAMSLPGTLLEIQAEALRDPPRDYTLLRERDTLVAREGPELMERWRVDCGERATQVLSWAPAIALWSPVGEEDGALECLDPATGRRLFRVASVTELFDPLPRRAGDGLIADPRGVECLRAGPLIALVRGDGEAVVLRMQGDGRPLWKLDAGGQVNLRCDLAEWGLALLQVSPEGLDQPARISIRDPRSGSLWLEGPWPESIGSPLWIRLLPEGIVVAGSGGVAMLDLQPQLPPRWVQGDRRVAGAEWRDRTTDWLMVKDRSSDAVQGISIDSGELLPSMLDGPSLGRMDPVANIRALPEGWLVHRFNRITLHDASGRRIGMDAVSGERRYDLVQPVRGGVVVVDLGDREAFFEAGRQPALLLRTLEPATGLRISGESLAVQTGGDRLVTLDAIEGWILVGLEGRTLAIRAPPGR